MNRIIELSSEIWSGQKMLEGNYILPNKETITIEKGTEIILKKILASL